MTMPPRRRLLLIGFASCVAALVPSVHRRMLQSFSEAKLSRLIAALGLDTQRLARTLPTSVRQIILEHGRALIDVDVTSLAEHEFLSAIRHQIHDDYAQGRIIDIDGWRLSLSEVGCLALLLEGASARS